MHAYNAYEICAATYDEMIIEISDSDIDKQNKIVNK